MIVDLIVDVALLQILLEGIGRVASFSKNV